MSYPAAEPRPGLVPLDELHSGLSTHRGCQQHARIPVPRPGNCSTQHEITPARMPKAQRELPSIALFPGCAPELSILMSLLRRAALRARLVSTLPRPRHHQVAPRRGRRSQREIPRGKFHLSAIRVPRYVQPTRESTPFVCRSG